jgi:hypothetical protein
MADFVSHPPGLHLQSAIGVCADTAPERMISEKEIRLPARTVIVRPTPILLRRGYVEECAARNLVSEEECIHFSDV